ncbi:MAG: hypothetical protein ABJN34_05125 [Litoreibacter sp.]|uniref:hypothetical protein n=1 Tax=Litoreibacter sp. TaxID=1969459 RepID=UPI003299376E
MSANRFFDAQYAHAKKQDIQEGLILYHGFQGEQPSLNDNQALWVSLNEDEAEGYSRLGNRIGRGGVLMLALKADQQALVGCPNGIRYLALIDSVHHAVFAKDLHRWAVQHGVCLVKENQDCFISFRARSDFHILSVTNWSNKGA